MRSAATACTPLESSLGALVMVAKAPSTMETSSIVSGVIVFKASSILERILAFLSRRSWYSGCVSNGGGDGL